MDNAPELRTLDSVRAMKLNILRKGNHSLFEDRDGLLISCLVGSRAEKAAEANICFKRIGVYDEKMKYENVLADIGV